MPPVSRPATLDRNVPGVRASDEALVATARTVTPDAVAARREVLDRYRPLVLSLARRFARRGLRSRDDLVSTGYEGMLKAVRDFDLDRGVPFAAYAQAKVHGEMLRWLRDTRYAVHVPRTLHERFMQVRRAEGDLTASLGRPPTVTDVARHLGIHEDEVVEALAVGSADRARTAMLTRVVGEARGDRVADLDVARAVATLPARSRLVLHRRYWEGATQQEVADEVGLSQAQVSRIERGALSHVGAELAPVGPAGA